MGQTNDAMTSVFELRDSSTDPDPSTLRLPPLSPLQVSTSPPLHSTFIERMGGDHKCPVCQATFTRPQHVARHMRSHTGDRPYKCQHCGDQFARSDLLSRHVNKCHSAEKDLGHPPLPGVAPGRRKGSSAATRATTSKQACDQCVQGSLPCDGSNPCAKCVARKVRCTFVKFHRQTAPVGPGHAASLVASHPSSTSSGAVLEPNPSSSSASGLPLPTLLPGLALTQPHLSANSPHPLHLAHPGESAPFLYAQQAASGGGGYHHGEYDSRSSYEQQQRRRDSDPYYPPPPGSAGSGAYYGGYRESFDGRDFDGRSIDSSDFDGRSDRGSSVGGGSRPQSSAGLPGGVSHLSCSPCLQTLTACRNTHRTSPTGATTPLHLSTSTTISSAEANSAVPLVSCRSMIRMCWQASRRTESRSSLTASLLSTLSRDSRHNPLAVARTRLTIPTPNSFPPLQPYSTSLLRIHTAVEPRCPLLDPPARQRRAS
ncbi:hypothetical protein FB45DRAFT_394411 [Roridomyces roridus]|uniref:Uncharacterized protein n=1 Tax=Roridomyces roridus TaxID=1738132 RepID=A0AAD7B1I5_9AGAR|nr:hypothetical protein FB45DRAFT_394411 [Roridomyces roridus]